MTSLRFDVVVADRSDNYRSNRGCETSFVVSDHSAVWLLRLNSAGRVSASGSTKRMPPEGLSVSIEEKVTAIVSEQLGVAKEEVKKESKFVDDLKADSLDVVELVMEFEDEFEITIPDDDYDKIKTVGDAISYITDKKNA